MIATKVNFIEHICKFDDVRVLQHTIQHRIKNIYTTDHISYYTKYYRNQNEEITIQETFKKFVEYSISQKYMPIHCYHYFIKNYSDIVDTEWCDELTEYIDDHSDKTNPELKKLFDSK